MFLSNPARFSTGRREVNEGFHGMRSVLFWAVMGLAMLVLMTAGLIRWELAAPGVSPLFLDAEGNPRGQTYNTVVTAHGWFGVVLMLLAGVWLGNLAVPDGARLHRLWIWPGTVLAAGLLAVLAYLLFADGSYSIFGEGWVFQLSLSGGAVSNTPLASPTHVVPMPASLLLPGLVALGLAFLLLGSFARIGSRPGFRWAAVLAALLTLGVTGIYLTTILPEDPVFGQIVFFMPLLVLTAMLSIILTDALPAWAPLLVIGAIAMLVSSMVLSVFGGYGYYDDTMTEVAIQHLGPGMLVWFVIAAGLVSRYRLTPGGAMPWILGAALVVTHLLAFAPLVQLGDMGMPRRYIDYPEAFARLNLLATGGAALLLVTLLAGLVTILRRRRP